MDGTFIVVDDKEVAFSDEANLLEVFEKNDIWVPQLCYRRKLSPCGHCGLCTVELFDEQAEGNWVPVLACLVRPEPHLKIRTTSERIEAIRELTGKLLLRSHPCDCEYCECFGDCELRKIYNRTGFGFTRALEDGKYKKPVIAQLSGRFLLDREKCIQCGLCVHFFREELGEDFIHLEAKDGVHTRLELYPGVSYQESYLLNAIEVCPVNAILDGQAGSGLPSWELRKVPSISTESSTGTNIYLCLEGNEVAYTKPRPNPQVNTYIPDKIRTLFQDNSLNRVDNLILKGQKTGLREAFIYFLTQTGLGHRSAIICSGSLSLEHFLLARRLADTLGAKIYIKNRRQEGDGWLISNDANTNIRGALLTQVLKGVAGENYGELETEIRNQQVQTVIALGEDILAEGFEKELLKQVTLISFMMKHNATTEASSLVFPITSVVEEDGHFINKDFLLQRYQKGVERSNTEAKPLWKWLALLRDAYMGRGPGEEEFQDIASIWKYLETGIPELAGISFKNLPLEGVKLDGNHFANYPFVA